MNSLQNESNELLVERYIKYRDSMSKANKKYRETHKEKMNELSKNYYHRKKNDEEFMEKMRTRARERYHAKKIAQQEKMENEIKNI